jgi:hypothetical protein
MEKATKQSMGAEPRYALGHSSKEPERLTAQARLIDPLPAVFLSRPEFDRACVYLMSAAALVMWPF